MDESFRKPEGESEDFPEDLEIDTEPHEDDTLLQRYLKFKMKEGLTLKQAYQQMAREMAEEDPGRGISQANNILEAARGLVDRARRARKEKLAKKPRKKNK